MPLRGRGVPSGSGVRGNRAGIREAPPRGVNISASLPQLKAAIKELQGKGYNVPDYPEPGAALGTCAPPPPFWTPPSRLPESGGHLGETVAPPDMEPLSMASEGLPKPRPCRSDGFLQRNPIPGDRRS